MIRRPLALALASVLSAALLPATAAAEDLLQTYELARESDPQLSASEASRRATREGAVQARAAMLPQINGTASLNRTRSTNDGLTEFEDGTTIDGIVTSETTTRQTGVELRQMIYDRSNFTRLKSQRALSEASDFQLESASDDLITRTSAAYFNVLIALESLAAAEAAETALQKQFDYASKRLEVGLAPITDVHEARAQYDSARANTILARNAVEDAYQALAEITGKPVRNVKGLPKDFQPSIPEARDAEAWVQLALENNPALRAAELQLRSAEADVETARAGHWPTLYLSGSYGDSDRWGDRSFMGSTFDIPDSHTYGPAVGITLSVPIFSGGAVQSGVRQALARRDQTNDQLEQQRRALVRNTRNAYQSLVASISEVEARRLALVSAQAAYDASQVGLEVGTRTVLDVLQNQRNLFDAQVEYARARYNHLQTRLELEQAAGTLDVADVQDINRLLTADVEAQMPAGDVPG
ncbi:TolC family outer membrane protein [Vulcaniibacterium tengchongense]|uniref:Protein CyaE n=1 Tax=Vulcaniibacterium tengchongense TaxID=1273429 RepID=A0A3N4V7U2_9GAMM|nr:TolC family outer membrane protein [Vulcaniibacterium tengchongense]RPE75769.1 outer membrane protein [Vulcaniibacterium tengchongense]